MHVVFFPVILPTIKLHCWEFKTENLGYPLFVLHVFLELSKILAQDRSEDMTLSSKEPIFLLQILLCLDLPPLASELIKHL